MNRRLSKPHGYLLMEAMLAGALLAVAIVSTLTMISSSKTDAIYANNQGVAAMLARAKADELASGTTATGCAPPLQGSFISVGAPYAAFRHRWNVAAATVPSTPATTAVVCDVDVTVRYPARVGSRQDLADGAADGQALINYRRLYTP